MTDFGLVTLITKIAVMQYFGQEKIKNLQKKDINFDLDKPTIQLTLFSFLDALKNGENYQIVPVILEIYSRKLQNKVLYKKKSYKSVCQIDLTSSKNISYQEK